MLFLSHLHVYLCAREVPASTSCLVLERALQLIVNNAYITIIVNQH